MRGLAEFVMAGRRQAIISVLLLGLLPLVNLLSPVAVSLVMLRKGAGEAGIILAWAVLPLLGWAILGDIVPLVLVFGMSALALLLRSTGSWEFTLLAAVGVGIAIEVVFRLQPQTLEPLYQQLELYLQQSGSQAISIEDIRAILPSILGAVYMFLAITLLFVARWLQARLYNPGGFREEFHGLRITQKAALPLVVLMLLSTFGLLPQAWVLYLVLPLLVSGVALAHGMIALKGLSSLWLVAFYLLLLLPWFVQLLVLAALIDSWYDFRGRLRGRPGPGT